MSIPQWERKRTIDAMFCNVPARYRRQFMERVNKCRQEQEQDEPVGTDTDAYAISAPDLGTPVDDTSSEIPTDEDSIAQATQDFVNRALFPLAKGPRFDLATAVASYADKRNVDPDDLYTKVIPALKKKGIDPARIKDSMEELGYGMTEITTSMMGFIPPVPVLIGAGSGAEDSLTNSAKTSSADTDGHKHTAYYDAAGNGYTSTDKGHSHSVRSFIVADYAAPDGESSHSHPGVLPRPDVSGNAQAGYTGELT